LLLLVEKWFQLEFLMNSKDFLKTKQKKMIKIEYQLFALLPISSSHSPNC